MKNKNYKEGYESATMTMSIFNDSKPSALKNYYNNMVNKRNQLDPEDFDTAKEYDDLINWYDGALDACEDYLKLK